MKKQTNKQHFKHVKFTPKVSPHVRGVAVVVGEFKQVIGASLLIREGALNFRLQHVLSNLVPALHALQVLLTPTLLCGAHVKIRN